MRPTFLSIAAALAALCSSESVRADNLGLGTPTTPPAVAAPSPAAPAAAPSAGAVRVHLRASRTRDIARLYVHAGDDRWALACTAPCKVDLAPGTQLRVTIGDYYDDPHDFSLQAEAGREIELEVRPASKGALAGGIVMTSLGGLTALVGLILFAVGSSSGSGVVNKGDLRTAGGICLGVGGGLTIGGILMITGRSHEPRVREDQYGTAQERGDLRSFLPVATTPVGLGFSF